jgi:hypothetical protein
MEKRVQLQSLLEGLLRSRNVYFQPPEDVKLCYPCIIYSRGIIGITQFANDKPYHYQNRYTLTVIDKNPDSEILDKVASLPMCTFERHYTADNLNHDVYNLYY